MTPPVLRVAGLTILTVAAIVAVVVGLVIGGGAAPRLTSDPGALVRWGLPVAKLLVNLSGAAMVGPLVLALFALTSGTKPFLTALNVASAGAAILTVASGTVAFLTFLSSFNPQVSLEAEFGAQLGRFLLDTELGRSWLITVIFASVVTVLAFAVRSYGAVLLTTMLAITTLVPMSTQGHSGELANHDAAVMSLVLHVISAAVWLGGLALLIVIRPGFPSSALEDALRRYSTLALIAFVVVATSGYARALTALGRWDDLVTPYGLILLAKIVALVMMGILGAAYRRRLIAEAGEGRDIFWVLVCVELTFMGVASGAAAALARTAAPADTITIPQTTAAEILTDAPVPPELTLERWLTAWSVDLLWVIVAGFGVFFYLAGVRRMRRLGHAWPMRRSIGWVIGMGALVWTTSGPLAVYDDFLISVRFLSFALLGLVIPVLLVSAAPLALALHVIYPRNDGSRGAREWLRWITQSPATRLALNPVITAALFAATIWLIPYSDLFRWSLYDQLGSEWLITHLLVVGCLFVRSLFRRGDVVTSSKLPRRWTLTALATLTVATAFIGIATITRTDLIVAEWFGAMGRTWGYTPLQDQRVGGIIIACLAALLAVLSAAAMLRPHRTRSDILTTQTLRKDAPL